MIVCKNGTCERPVILETDGSPPLFCTCCGWSLPIALFEHLLSESVEKNCRNCGKISRKRLDGCPALFCSRCGWSKLAIPEWVFDKKKREKSGDDFHDMVSLASEMSDMKNFSEDFENEDLDMSADEGIRLTKKPYAGNSEVKNTSPKAKISDYSNLKNCEVKTEKVDFVANENTDAASDDTPLSLYICQYCDAIFVSDDQLQTHLNVCAKNPQVVENNDASLPVSDYPNPILMASSVKKDSPKIGDPDRKGNSAQGAFLYCSQCNQYYDSGSPHHHTTAVPLLSVSHPVAQRAAPRKSKSINRYNCKFCTRKFPTTDAMTEHMETHTIVQAENSSMWRCRKCDFFSESRESARNHAVIHKPKDKKCPICLKLFRSTNYLRDHMNIHTGVNPYSCDKCNKSFKSRSHRNRHKRQNCISNRIEKSLCYQCGKYYSHLAEHIRCMHRQPFKCDVCDMTFSKKTKLTEHSMVHTGEKPYKCDYCSYASKQAGYLKTHIAKCSKRPGENDGDDT